MGSLGGGVDPQESLVMRGFLLKRIFSARGKAVASWQKGLAVFAVVRLVRTPTLSNFSSMREKAASKRLK
jgi:hypothetical protein